MRLHIKFFIFIFFFLTILNIVPEVSADLIIPDCKWNEIKVTCVREYRKGDAVIPSNECSKYKNDPKFYFLWEIGNISDIKTINNVFCRKGIILEIVDKYKYFVGIPLLITTILELFVFVISGYRKIKELLNIILVNCISLPIGYLSFPIIRDAFSASVYYFFVNVIEGIYSNPARITEDVLVVVLTLLIIEIAVVIFETLFLIYVSKFGNKKRVLITVIISNFISLVLRAGILSLR